jgi:hypothetical protein
MCLREKFWRKSRRASLERADLSELTFKANLEAQTSVARISKA